MACYDIYSDQLASLRRGHALWEPDPAGEYTQVEVGDVGYCMWGSFQRLFNILLPAEHPSQNRGVPECFEPLILPEDRRIKKRTLPAGKYMSRGVRHVEIAASAQGAVAESVSGEGKVEFLCHQDAGAVLVTAGVAKCHDIIHRRAFEIYMHKHTDYWIAFAENLQLGVEEEDLMLVTGCDLTTSWAMAAFKKECKDVAIALEVRTPGGGCSLSARMAWANGHHVDHNCGPVIEGITTQGEGNDDARSGLGAHHLQENQCIFVRSYHWKKRKFLPKKLRAAAGYSDIHEYRDKERLSGRGSPSSSARDSAVDLILDPSDREYQPLHGPMLDYILESSHVGMAIVHDDDLVPYLGINPSAINVVTQLKTEQPFVQREYGMHFAIGGVGKILAKEQGTPSSEAPYNGNEQAIYPGSPLRKTFSGRSIRSSDSVIAAIGGVGEIPAKEQRTLSSEIPRNGKGQAIFPRSPINSSSRRPQRTHMTGVGTKQGKDSTVGAVTHASARSPMGRFVTAQHGQHPLVQRKAAGGGESKGRGTLNVGSLGSSGSRKTWSTSPPESLPERGEESKEKRNGTNSTTSNPLAPLQPLQPAYPSPSNALAPLLTKTTSAPERGSSKATTGLTTAETDARTMPPGPIPPSRATQAKPPLPPTAPASSTRQPNPQQQRGDIFVQYSSDENETTADDSEDDSGSWTSEDMSADGTTHPTNTKRNHANLNAFKKMTAQEFEEAQVRESYLQVEREREIFAKQPKRSYSNLNRTHSGFLSTLLNPYPSLFPENQPARVMSLNDMSSASGLERMGQGRGQSQAGPARPSMAMPTLSTSKSAAALPFAAQVTSQAPKTNGTGASPNNDRHNADAGKGRYQPKGRPQDPETDSDSETDAESPSNLSRSHAHEKLAALAAENNLRRRHSDRPTTSTSTSTSKPPHPFDPPMPTRPTLPSVATVPIPLNHSWNLPMTAAAHSTSRATRRQMVNTEISESVRRNLLWERQVNMPQVSGLKKRSMSTAGAMIGMDGQALGSGLRPLTSTTGQPGQKREGQGQQWQGQDKGKARAKGDSARGMDEQTEREYNERKKKAMERDRSWADDYHYLGW